LICEVGCALGFCGIPQGQGAASLMKSHGCEYGDLEQCKIDMKNQNESINWPHVGKLIDMELGRLGMTKAEFGRRLGTSRQNVNSLLKKEFLQSDIMAQVSLILGIDLFAPYSQLIADPKQPVPRQPDIIRQEPDVESLRLLALMQETIAKLNQRFIQ
jgi:hypothetical protein